MRGREKEWKAGRGIWKCNRETALEKQFDFLAFAGVKGLLRAQEQHHFSPALSSTLCRMGHIFLYKWRCFLALALAPAWLCKLSLKTQSNRNFVLNTVLFQEVPLPQPSACPTFGALLLVPTFSQARSSPCDHHHCFLQVSSHPHPLQQPEKAEDAQAAKKQWDDDCAGEIHQFSFLNSLPRATRRKQIDHFITEEISRGLKTREVAFLMPASDHQ